MISPNSTLTLRPCAAPTKGAALANSADFDVHRWSDFAEVNGAVAFLYEQLRCGSHLSGKARLQKKHIKVVLLNLYANWLPDPKQYTAYYRMKAAYEGTSRYNKLHISYLTVPIVDALLEQGYIEHVMGHYGRDGLHSSHKSRMRATEKLIRLIMNRGFRPKMVETYSKRECVILRNEEKQDMEYKETTFTRKTRKELEAYNRLLLGTEIELSATQVGQDPPRNQRPRIDVTNKFVRRIFNRSWSEGGRFYGGWWQSLPKEWRSQILIDGEPTVELDYGGQHIGILYALEGISYWHTIKTDPYELDGCEKSERMRKLVKLAFLIAINAGTKTSALRAIRKKLRSEKLRQDFIWVKDEDVDLAKLLDAFGERHNPIKHYLYSGYGTKLQRIDSEMAAQVVRAMVEKKIPVLCIHDSFVVIKKDAFEVMSAMTYAYCSILEKYTNISGLVKPGIKGNYEHLLTQDELASWFSLKPWTREELIEEIGEDALEGPDRDAVILT